MSEPSPQRFLNRELSWLEFNQRVLDEAMDGTVPPLERMKFLAITASNLDEFFMVRIGGLRMLADQGNARRDISGLTPTEQIERVAERAHRMVADQYACLAEALEPALAEAGIRRLRVEDLSAEQAQHAERLFEQELFPLLTPRAVDPDPGEWPLLPGLTVHLALRLHPPEASAGDAPRTAVVAIPRSVPRYYTVPAEHGSEFVMTEDLVAAHLERLFPGSEILEAGAFRLTRNADMSVSEDLAADLLAQMQEVLVARRLSDTLRLEVAGDLSEDLRAVLCAPLGVTERDRYACPGPLDLSCFFGFATLAGHEELKDEPWPPQPVPALAGFESMFEAIAARDVLQFSPYESYEPIVRFVQEAADDPDVLAIKQILYRTSRDSPIVAALARAAQHGKQVTALVELKARFDEARNIEWAQALEEAGVQVVYGIKRLKTHAKICLVVRREPQGIRRYIHFGTGNYNEQTARVYSDASYLTCDEDYGRDATAFFNTVTGYSQPLRYRKIDAAPLGLRNRLLALIRGEAQRSRAGQDARIQAKVNSLADPEVIEELYAASQAGVQIDLNVRGICCLRPGVEGLSENIRVVSVVDRFLEHARILYFRHGGEEQVFLSSADWMPRNLDKRIELLVPVSDPPARQRLLAILRTCLRDTAKGRVLLPDGGYRPPRRGRGGAVRCQEQFYREACEAARALRDSQKAVFEPHLPPSARDARP